MSRENIKRSRLPLLDVVTNAQTYRNIGYLLLSFPLGIAYFITLVIGLTLGVGFSVIWIGIPQLVAMLALCDGFAAFEREMVSGMLGGSIATPRREPPEKQGIWPQLQSYLTTPSTWNSLLFLMLKLPLGIISFVTTVSFLVVTLALIATPLLYQVLPINIGYDMVTRTPIPMTGLHEALIFTLIGLVFGVVSLHALNALAAFYRAIATSLLGGAERAAPQLAEQEHAEPVAQTRLFINR